MVLFRVRIPRALDLLALILQNREDIDPSGSFYREYRSYMYVHVLVE